MIIARQSTARTVIVGPVLDADGVAVTDGVVGDFKISKNGGAPATLNGSATLTHRNTGHYSLALTTSDLDTVGQAEIVIDDTVNACPVKVITVIEEAVYDNLFAASAPGPLAANSTGSGLSAIPWNASWDAEVQSEAADALNAYDPPTNAEMVARTLAAASYATATALQTVDDEIAAIDLVVDAILVDTAEIGAAGAGLTEAGGTGDHLTAVASASALATVDSNVDAILADTGTDGVIVATNNDKTGYAIGTGGIAAAAFASGAIDAAALAADASTEIGAGVLTAAAADPIAANVKEVNDTALTGDGNETPWGPA